MAESNYHFKEVSIVILNWNGRTYLQKFLPYVLNTIYPAIKIIVADNNSSDDSVAFVQQNFPSVIVMQSADNKGFAGGYNFFLDQIKSDFYVLLNNDVEVSPGWLGPIIELMESDKNIAACQPKILQYSDRKNFEYAGACGGFIDHLGYPFARGRIFDICETDKMQYEKPISCFWATGAAMVVRADLYRSSGGLDASFFAHQEEIDLCWRLQLLGFKIFVHPASVVYHVGGGTLPKANSNKTYLNFRNNLVMLAKNLLLKEAIWKIPVRMLLDIVAAYKALFSGNGKEFVAIAKAHISFLLAIFKGKIRSSTGRKKMNRLDGVYSKSIVWQYFIKGKKSFNEIIKL